MPRRKLTQSEKLERWQKKQGHPYRDGCSCVWCTATWNAALMEALDRGEKKLEASERGDR